MRYALFALVLVAGCSNHTSPAPPAAAPTTAASQLSPLEIYFVRHGETVSNATGKYNDADLNRLTPAGEAQAKAVAKALAGIQFDAAVVSPSLRAEITAEPTLREHKMTAVIWPEMNECCTEKADARKLPASKRLGRGPRIYVPANLSTVLTVDQRDLFSIAPANYADGITQVRLAAQHLGLEFDHKKKPKGDVFRVLVVGHAAQGSRFLDVLLGRDPIGDIEIKNGSITVLRREPGGAFKLVREVPNPNKSKQDDGKMTSRPI